MTKIQAVKFCTIFYNFSNMYMRREHLKFDLKLGLLYSFLSVCTLRYFPNDNRTTIIFLDFTNIDVLSKQILLYTNFLRSNHRSLKIILKMH